MSRASRAIEYPTSIEELTAEEHLRLHSGYVVRDSGCWEWTKATSGSGYPMVYVRGRYHQAHRLIFGLTFHAIPPTWDVDHKCRNPLCVNPAHLEAVTHNENVRRGYDPNYNPAYAPSQERVDEHVARRLGVA